MAISPEIPAARSKRKLCEKGGAGLGQPLHSLSLSDTMGIELSGRTTARYVIVMQPPAEDFLQACGALAPLQLEVEHAERGELARWTTALPFALIGRDARADLRLDDKQVSRRHAYLQIVAGRCWWVDLNSRTGTYPDGDVTVSEETDHTASVRQRLRFGPLLGRRRISIGPFTIRLAGGGSADEDDSTGLTNPLIRGADDLSPSPRRILEFVGTEQQRTWMVDRPLALIGRAAFCKVQLHSPLVSRTHCALVNTPAGLWVVDLLSKGTCVNGTAVRWAQLEQEDELHIDPFRISVRTLAPSTLPTIPNGQEVVPSVQSLVPSALGVPSNGNERLLLPLMKQFTSMQQQMFEQFQQTLLMMAQMFGKLNREQMVHVRQELKQIHELKRQIQALQANGTRSTPAEAPEQPEMPLPPIMSPPPANGTKAFAAAHTATDQPAARTEGEVHMWLAQRLTALQQERQTRWQRLLTLLTGK